MPEEGREREKKACTCVFLKSSVLWHGGEKTGGAKAPNEGKSMSDI